MTKEKFLSKVNKAEKCWEWLGFINEKGYGESYAGGKKSAHRLSYELFNGKIPHGLQIDHLCRNRKCVNPDHLEAVSRRVNILRGQAPSANNARKDICKKGHPYKGDNLVLYKRKQTNTWWRVCRECRRTWLLKHFDKTRNKGKYQRASRQ